MSNTFLESISLTTVTSFLVAIAAIITAIVGWRKTRTEANNTIAAAIKTYEEAVAMSAKRNQELQDRIDKLEGKVDDLSAVIKLKDERIAELECLTAAQQEEIRKLRDEVAELRLQLSAYNA